MLECLGTKAAKRLRARISYAPVGDGKLYQEKQRFDSLGDSLPSGAVLQWGTNRFSFYRHHEIRSAISNDGTLVATGPGVKADAPLGSDFGPPLIQIWDARTGA